MPDQNPPSSALALAPGAPLAPDRCPVRVYLAGRAPGSRRALYGALRALAETIAGVPLAPELVPWWRLEPAHVEALRAAMVTRYAPATGRRAMAALRGVLRRSVRLGLMDRLAFEAAIDVEPIAGGGTPPGRALEAGELEALLRAARSDQQRALVALAYGAGLRRSELVRLDLVHVELGDRPVVRVRAGKGRRDRDVPLPAGAAAHLERWIATRGTTPGPLFCPVRPFSVRRLSDQWVLDTLRRLARRASVAAFSPHDMRRSYLSALLDLGVDLATVQSLAGHASPTTTARYDRRGERARRDGAARLHVPFPV